MFSTYKTFHRYFSRLFQFTFIRKSWSTSIGETKLV